MGEFSAWPTDEPSGRPGHRVHGEAVVHEQLKFLPRRKRLRARSDVGENDGLLLQQIVQGHGRNLRRSIRRLRPMNCRSDSGVSAFPGRMLPWSNRKRSLRKQCNAHSGGRRQSVRLECGRARSGDADSRSNHIARDYSIASPAANGGAGFKILLMPDAGSDLETLDLETLKPSLTQLLRNVPPGIPAVRRRSGPTVSSQNHLIRADSYLGAQRHHLGDRALQRFFLRRVSGSAWIVAYGCRRIAVLSPFEHSTLCGCNWIRGHDSRTGIRHRSGADLQL